VKSWDYSLLEHCGPEESVYLIHSFQYLPTNSSDLLAIYYRDDKPIAAAISYQNVTGLQFHPEKSGEAGLKIIRNL
jgi:glutamine amidotransferase